MTSDLFLNDTWTLYFHDPDNSSWDMDSYQVLASVSSVQDWAKLVGSFQEVWNKGMFFLMREHILPIWEDEHNKNGGCISFKLWKNEVTPKWLELTARTLGEVLVNGADWQKVCGVSISPKRSYCIARIWLADDSVKEFSYSFPEYSKVMYKSHMENKDYEVATGPSG